MIDQINIRTRMNKNHKVIVDNLSYDRLGLVIREISPSRLGQCRCRTRRV